MSVAEALRVAANVIRALPDHDLLALALRAEAGDDLARANLRLQDQRPTAALRDEIATRQIGERQYVVVDDEVVGAAIEVGTDLRSEPVVDRDTKPEKKEVAKSAPRPTRATQSRGREPVVQQRVLDLLRKSPKTLEQLVAVIGEKMAVKNALSRLRIKGFIKRPSELGGPWGLA